MENMRDMIILIAEDDDGHAELIKDGLLDVGLCDQIIRFENGEETWNFLNTEGLKNNSTNHYLLLLDINMPRMDGIEVLRRIKENPIIQDMPVIMLTTTDDPREVEECYRIGCNFYVTKPVDFLLFAETLKRLGLFLQIVRI